MTTSSVTAKSRSMPKSNKGRKVNLLLDASYEFNSNSRPTAEQISRFKELFYSFIDQVGEQEKRNIAIAIANNVYTPRQIAIYLALEESTIGAPILLYSKALTDFDLVSISAKCALQSLRILARRTDLTRSAVRAIIARRDDLAMQLLRLNPGVKTILEEVGLVSEKPRITPTPSQSGNGASDRLRTQRLKQKQLEILDIAGRGGKLGSEHSRPVNIIATNGDTENTDLITIARSGNRIEFVEALARKMGADPIQFKGLLDANREFALPMALRALAIPRNTASQIMLFVDKEVGLSVEKLRAFTSRYETLDSEYCKSQFRRFGASFKASHNRLDRNKTAPNVEYRPASDPELARALQDRRSAIQLTNPKRRFGRTSNAA